MRKFHNTRSETTIHSSRSLLRVLLAITLLATALCWAEDQPGTAKLAFTKMRSLAGDWEGTVKWTGARSDTGKMNARYYLTGNGSALVEDLSTEATPSMTSVYHLDGDELRVTHFCGAQNQPRLKASRIDLAKGSIDFDFVDITNLRSPDAPHVYGLSLDMPSPNRLEITFLFEAAGKKSREQISLTRATSAQ